MDGLIREGLKERSSVARCWVAFRLAINVPIIRAM